MSGARKKEEEPYVTSKKEADDVRRGQALMKAAKGTSAEEEIEEYLQKFGLIVDDTLSGKRANAERHRRYNYYLSVDALLRNYRRMRNLYTLFKQEFADRLEEEDVGEGAEVSSSDSEHLFSRLSAKLELLSAYDEKKMRRCYEPNIVCNQQIEMAMAALEHAMNLLKMEDKQSWAIINYVYIEGDHRPTVRETIGTLGLAASSSYYQKKEKAIQKLTELMFGWATDREKLFNILVFLMQQTTDAETPEI